MSKSRKRFHKIWRVCIGDRSDGPVKCVQDLPLRGDYLIESSHRNGIPTIEKKAIALATEDGILLPVILSMEWDNPPAKLVE